MEESQVVTPIPVGTKFKTDVDTAGVNRHRIGSDLMPYDVISDGRQTVDAAGTPQPLSDDPVPCSIVVVQGLDDNADIVAVGADTVDAALGAQRGHLLEALDSIVIPIDDAAKLFVDARASDEGVTWTAYGLLD